MSFGQYIIGFIFLVIAYFIGIFGFCQIVGSILIYPSRATFIHNEGHLKRLKKALIPFIIWVIILCGIAFLDVWLFPKYKVFFFIGYGIGFIMSLFNMRHLAIEAMQNAQAESERLQNALKILKENSED